MSLSSRAAAFLSGITAFTVEAAAEWTVAAFTLPGAVVKAVVHATEARESQR
jgi:hypothetical protein